MRITSLDEYGLRCLLAIAVKGPGAQLSIPEIAEMEGLSESYVGKLLSLLKKGKLIEAVRGRAGGFSLARSPDKITLLEAVTTLGGPLIDVDHCDRYTGHLEKCVHFECCSVRYILGGLAESVGEFMSQTTLADIINANDLNVKEWQAGIARTNMLLPDNKTAKQPGFKV
ncbi:MAG: Rrf2 family transcriptional regulator [candidate division Zixibacteria bacterium]|jgi:Rrf2 family protein